MFQFLNYISDTGGVVGLWFGIAIWTIFETIEFLTDVVVYSLRKLIRWLRKKFTTFTARAADGQRNAH